MQKTLHSLLLLVIIIIIHYALNTKSDFDFNVIHNRDSLPEIFIFQKTSLGFAKNVSISYNTFEIEGNAIEIYFECYSTYPTKWMTIPSPVKNGSSVVSWKIDKYRIVKSDQILNISSYIYKSCISFKLLNLPTRIFTQNAACHHVDDPMLNINISVVTVEDGKLKGELIHGQGLSRGMKKGDRYGRNQNCKQEIIVDLDRLAVGCLNKEERLTKKPDFIECANPDECEGTVQKSDSYCPSPSSILESCKNNKTKCESFGKISGALVCETQGEERRNSVAQIVFFNLKNIAFAYNYSTPKAPNRLKIESIAGNTKKVYTKQPSFLQFKCTGVIWSFTQGFQWALKFSNHSTIKYLGKGLSTEDGRSVYTSTKKIELEYSITGRVRIYCIAPIWNSDGWENISIVVYVKKTVPPEILNITKSNNQNETVTLACFVRFVRGLPEPNITWYRDGVELLNSDWRNSKVTKDIVSSKLNIPNTSATKSEDVEFTCEGMISGQSDKKSIWISYNGSGIGLGLAIGVSTFFLCLFSCIIIYLIRRIRDKNKQIERLTEDEILEFNQGNPNIGQDSAHFYPYNTDFEISKSRITFESKILGDGQFGRVTRGKYNNKFVAIKTVKKFADISYLKALLSELKICCYVGKHENIVNLIGGCTQNIHKREVYVLYEYCANGNMKKYLQKCRDQFVNHLDMGKYKRIRQSVINYQNISVKKISSMDLLKWCAEIASGMEFLSSKNIIHGDLAARNVLLTDSLVAKVGDFGLSKQLNEYSIYVQSLECPLPLKWMAIESLRDLEFSVKTDVWSFGVTMWEIYTLGEVPYPGFVQWDSSSWKTLLEGYRMEKPQYASDRVYEIMLKCWDPIPDSRPSFLFIKEMCYMDLRNL